MRPSARLSGVVPGQHSFTASFLTPGIPCSPTLSAVSEKAARGRHCSDMGAAGSPSSHSTSYISALGDQSARRFTRRTQPSLALDPSFAFPSATLAIGNKRRLMAIRAVWQQSAPHLLAEAVMQLGVGGRTPCHQQPHCSRIACQQGSKERRAAPQKLAVQHVPRLQRESKVHRHG